MKEVIRIDREENEEKGVEFTGLLQLGKGWVEPLGTPGEFHKIVYLGRCDINGDMFATYLEGSGGKSIGLHKGHLNSGKY